MSRYVRKAFTDRSGILDGYDKRNQRQACEFQGRETAHFKENREIARISTDQTEKKP